MLVFFFFFFEKTVQRGRHCGILLKYRKIKQNCTKHGDDAIPRE